jgi:hypothetical protein
MSKYKLDDLMDWGRVLDELEELRRLQLLDEHQDGLKRILRYKPNWRLRECALQCAKEVAVPRDGLIEEACAVMCDEDSYTELRMLAAEAVGRLVRASCLRAGGVPSFKGVSVPETMRRLLADHISPLLRQKLVAVLEEVAAAEVPYHE